MSNVDNSISFEIQERIGTIAVYPTGWSKELNLVSWNGGAPEYDIRDWSPDHSRMGKGVTLTIDELAALRDILNEIPHRLNVLICPFCILSLRSCCCGNFLHDSADLVDGVV